MVVDWQGEILANLSGSLCKLVLRRRTAAEKLQIPSTKLQNIEAPNFKRRRAIPCLMANALVFKRLVISGFPTASRLGEAGEFR